MGTLKAAAGEVDLAPAAGNWMTGFAARIQPATGVHDPIMARALLLDDGSTRLAVVSCDLLGFAPADVAWMRRRIVLSQALPESQILIVCTHTHSGPACMRLRGIMGQVNGAWLAEARAMIIDLVARLPERLAPAHLALASTTLAGIGYNRQDQAHPTDEELIALSIEAEDGSTIATIANYATHAVVLGPSNLQFSGDFPGAVVRHLARLRGGVGLYLQGACGDVDPVVHRDRGWNTGTFADAEAIGKRLATAATQALAGAPRTGEVTLRVAYKRVSVPLDPPPARDNLAELTTRWEAERRQAKAEGNAMAEWIAVAMLDWADELEWALATGAVPRTLPSELFVAGINDLRLVALPFETYTDIGLEIKRGLAPRPALFAGYANGLYGYCPTRWAKDQGGYGPGDSHRWFSELLTPIGYGADELLIREGIALASSL